MTKIIQIKNPLQVRKNQKCDFCGEQRPCVVSEISKATICYSCQMAAKEVLGLIPNSSACCLSCHKHDYIIVEMEKGVKAHYRSPGLDINGITSYVLCETTGKVKTGMKRHSAECGHCHKVIPLYILDRNLYIL